MKQISDSDFQNVVASGTHLIDFYADWCGPCRVLTPILEEIATETTSVVFSKVNTDESQATAEKYQITSLPTMILIHNGVELGRLLGLRDKETVEAFIASHTSS